MTRSDFGKCSALAVAVLAIVLAGAFDARAQQAINSGDVLTGQLNAMRSRAKGKRVNTFQLVSEPHRLPPPSGLCGLETGPETFQIVTNSDAQAAQLKGFVGKEVSVKIDEVTCAQEAGQMSEAVVTKWSVVTKH
jgi:phage terminase large subunit-like protein